MDVSDFLDSYVARGRVKMNELLDEWWTSGAPFTVDLGDKLGKLLIMCGHSAVCEVRRTGLGHMLRVQNISFNGRLAYLRLHVTAADATAVEDAPLGDLKPIGRRGRTRTGIMRRRWSA